MSENMIRIQKATIHILTRRLEEAVAEVKRLREAIADIAKNMQAADPSYLQGFIKDLSEVIEHGE